jgi:quinol monooxygenase YgiN
MYIVTVKFYIKPQHINDFMPAMQQQAKDSLEKEAACSYFDVAISEQDPTLVFLYEIYDNKAAFDLHLASEHFIQFSAKVSDWVKDKAVETYSLVR